MQIEVKESTVKDSISLTYHGKFDYYLSIENGFVNMGVKENNQFISLTKVSIPNVDIDSMLKEMNNQYLASVAIFTVLASLESFPIETTVPKEKLRDVVNDVQNVFGMMCWYNEKNDFTIVRNEEIKKNKEFNDSLN